MPPTRDVWQSHPRSFQSELTKTRHVGVTNLDGLKPSRFPDAGGVCFDEPPDRTLGADVYPIFFRKRSAQTQKRNAAMPVMVASDCQYSKKLAPRRMMARMSEMK